MPMYVFCLDNKQKDEKIAIIILYVIGIQQISFAQSKYTVSGYVSERESKELLEGVSVYVKELGNGTLSNAYGFYSITMFERDSLSLIFRM